MKGLLKISPIVFCFGANAQNGSESDLRFIEYGYCAATYFNGDAFVFNKTNTANNDSYNRTPDTVPNLNFSYGWKQGTFVWLNINSDFSIKIELAGTFCVNNLKNNSANTDQKMNYSMGYGIEFKPQLIVKLGNVNRHPIIKMAKCMSYYLSGRQSYLIMGPKFALQKTDKQVLAGSPLNYLSVGSMFGVGMDNMFPNLDVAPEIYVSFDFQPNQNNFFPNSNSRYFASVTLALNIF